MARPPSCMCGECENCRRRDRDRRNYQRKSLEERRAWWARRDPDKVREQHRRKMAKRRTAGTPEQRLKIKVRNQVRAALKSGRLVRGSCEVCGTDENVHAHHDDYGRPLDVRWLCQDHHFEVHAAELRAA